jgi:hypothetical protein
MVSQCRAVMRRDVKFRRTTKSPFFHREIITLNRVLKLKNTTCFFPTTVLQWVMNPNPNFLPLHRKPWILNPKPWTLNPKP